MKALYLQPGREKRILQGHSWIFSNEVAGRLADYEPGSWVQVYSGKKVLLGSGYVNPQSLIAVRLVCPPGQDPTREFFADMLRRAAERRSQWFYPGATCYRVVYGEADGLPGLVVDRYGDILVYQITTLGMARMEPLVQELLIEYFKPQALVFRHDVPVRQMEQLPQVKGVAHGTLPRECQVTLDGLQYVVEPLEGQKTGLYLDQRDNRKALKPWAKGRKVLDLFCYNGAWSLTAAAGGAREVLGVDQSKEAVQQAQTNALRNQLHDRCRFEAHDTFQFCKQLPRGAFDIIIVDPPAFAKNKSSLRDAMKGYTDLNRRALLALAAGGLLVSCSCSYHLSEDLFRQVLLQAARASGRQLRLLEARGQALDHPALLAMPETRYLKCYFLEAR